MKTNLKLLMSIITILAFIFLTSCGGDEEGEGTGTVALSVTADGASSFSSGGRAEGRMNANVVITDFQISIRDIIFKTDLDDTGIADDTTNVAFRGPFALDLLDASSALAQSLGNVELPVGAYQEIRFKFHKTRDVATDHPLYDRSIYIAGTIDDTPFVMWHDTSENLDIGKSTGVIVDENGVSVDIVFTIDQFFNGMDISGAQDNDEDGVIEIDPDDSDDNKEYADILKDNIKAAADFFDEQ